MGWFYEVDITDDILSGDYDRFMEGGKIVAQGKNSTMEYEDYYMENGKPYRYSNTSNLMPDVEGYSSDLRLCITCGDPNSRKWEYIELEPVYFNGRWYLQEALANKGDKNE